jgi:hypothetical protein
LGRNDAGLTDESMVLAIEEAPDDYYRSKIETDAVIFAFLDRHPDMHISLVLPGWMHGPGDLGPTSAGQFVEDYLQQKFRAWSMRRSRWWMPAMWRKSLWHPAKRGTGRALFGCGPPRQHGQPVADHGSCQWRSRPTSQTAAHAVVCHRIFAGSLCSTKR